MIIEIGDTSRARKYLGSCTYTAIPDVQVVARSRCRGLLILLSTRLPLTEAFNFNSMSCSETGKRSDNVAHPIWTEIGAQETGAGSGARAAGSGGIGREARAVEIPGGKVMGGGCETARSRGSSSSGPGTAGIGGGVAYGIASAARAAVADAEARWCAGQRDQAAVRESAEKEGIFIPAVRVPGQRREAPEGEKAGEQEPSPCSSGGREAGGGKRRPGGRQRQDVECCITNGKRATQRRCVWRKQRGRGERFGGGQTAEYPVANTCKHPPNPVTDAAPPHGPSDRRGGVFDGRAAHLMEGPVKEHRWPAAYRWKVE
ncbi:hypothetical protein B0H11DRAFT_2204609 [Mycena galericulata]|nr:hypothetical protein B0H11DRAFT_2204609 [Mycena galericulata]